MEEEKEVAIATIKMDETTTEHASYSLSGEESPRDDPTDTGNKNSEDLAPRNNLILIPLRNMELDYEVVDKIGKTIDNLSVNEDSSILVVNPIELKAIGAHQDEEVKEMFEFKEATTDKPLFIEEKHEDGVEEVKEMIDLEEVNEESLAIKEHENKECKSPDKEKPEEVIVNVEDDPFIPKIIDSAAQDLASTEVAMENSVSQKIDNNIVEVAPLAVNVDDDIEMIDDSTKSDADESVFIKKITVQQVGLEEKKIMKEKEIEVVAVMVGVKQGIEIVNVGIENVPDQVTSNEGQEDQTKSNVDDVIFLEDEDDVEMSVAENKNDSVDSVDNLIAISDSENNSDMLDVSTDSRRDSVVSELDTTNEAVNKSFVSVDESADDDATDDDMPQIIDDFPSTRTRSGKISLNSSTTSVNDSLNLSVSSLDLSKDTASLASQKCSNCRQRLSVVKHYQPGSGKGEKELLSDPLVNIMMDEEDQRALQYKLTDFAVYDRVGDSGGHLVPIFAESLLSTGKKIYLSGKVLRLDSQEDDKGLQVVDIGPLNQWSNLTGMDGGQENIILTTSYGTNDVDFNLMKPCEEYLEMFQTTYRMVYMANKIITKLIDYNENGMFMEYAELLEFIDGLDPPVLYGQTLPACDEEFLQLHSDFIVSEVSSFEDAGDVEEDLTIMGMPCIKHISDMAGVERAPRRGHVRREGMVGSTPQPETHVKAVTTPLVAELFESTFQKQMKLNAASKTKVCTCKACQSNNCGRCERCREMVSFGGLEQDSEVVCLERQCLRRNDQEVVLGDEEDVVSKKLSKKLTKVKFIGKGEDGAAGKVYYDEVELRMSGGEVEVVKPGDFLLIAPDTAEHKSVPHYPCRVLYLLSREMQGQLYDCAHVQWLCRSENTVLGRTGDPREWFLINECEDVVLSEVSKVVDIEQVKVANIKRWKKLGGTKEAIMKVDEGGKDGWWRMIYIPEFGRFVYPKEKELNLGKGGECYFCNEREEQIKGEEMKVGTDGLSVRINNKWFTVGQFMMLEDNTIRFKIPKKEPKVYPKAKVDPKIYPEHYRKANEYKGDHYDTWDPLQVVRLEQIVQEKNETYLRVRKLYRPHDTHMTHEHARTKPYTLLYWTGEICRMHFPEVARRTNKVSVEAVVGPAWVNSIGDMDKMVDWSDEGEDRFIISEVYNSDTKTFSSLPAEVISELQSILISNPAPTLAAIPPLACLDIFAGCGGLSKGLHESGVTNHKWAIEFWPPSARAFKKNNPECEVLNEECNDLLNKVMRGERGTRMPAKGEVDMMVGGPPCQGFSLLNIYKEREYSKFKNSLIPTYLSFCDFYRPRYFILENVRNLVANENGMVLKLIIATLVKMGYQVAFNILQAGHYGVAQTRRRLIVIGAAPGEVLPVYPEPVHCFQGPHFQEIEVDGRKFSTTSTRPGAPRRSLTSWDAISDLPPISSGHDNVAIPYSYKIKGKHNPGKHESHLQKMFRSRNLPGSMLEDHICKDVNALCLERIRHVPTTPGSDWRDLPNTTVHLDDGRVTRKLHYPYKKADGTRGVCSCSLSTKQRMHFCDADDKQSETMIAWSLPHTADRHNNWQGVYGRVPWDGIFKTTITDPEPLGKQGQVVHPEQDRLLSVREYARSQGFKDNFKFDGTIRDKHREIGNAVPPPLGRALGLEIRKAILKKVA